jgi:transposase
VTVDALGNPLGFLLTAGQAHEAPQAAALLAGYEADFVLWDRGYDAEPIRLTIAELGAQAVIPPKSNRQDPANYDRELYKEPHLIEGFLGKLKHFRRCFSRFDKLARNYLSFLYFASALISLR